MVSALSHVLDGSNSRKLTASLFDPESLSRIVNISHGPLAADSVYLSSLPRHGPRSRPLAASGREREPIVGNSHLHLYNVAKLSLVLINRISR